MKGVFLGGGGDMKMKFFSSFIYTMLFTFRGIFTLFSSSMNERRNTFLKSSPLLENLGRYPRDKKS